MSLFLYLAQPVLPSAQLSECSMCSVCPRGPEPLPSHTALLVHCPKTLSSGRALQHSHHSWTPNMNSGSSAGEILETYGCWYSPSLGISLLQTLSDDLLKCELGTHSGSFLLVLLPCSQCPALPGGKPVLFLLFSCHNDLQDPITEDGVHPLD